MTCAALLLAAAAGTVHAQRTTYKCADGSYSDRPCAGGRKLGDRSARKTERPDAVPQDRAKIARRAVLTNEERAECRVLDGRLAEQDAFVKSKGKDITLEEEMPLVHTKRRMRELKC